VATEREPLDSDMSNPETLSGLLDRLDEEGKTWRDQWGGQAWDTNVKIIRSDIWPDKSTTPMFSANIISPAIRRKSSLLVESKPILDVRPRRSGLKPTADTLKKTIRAVWDEQSIAMSLEALAYYVASFGNGLFKLTYDRWADFGDGGIIVLPTDPRLIKIDPAVVKAYDLDKAQYIIEESVVPLSWVRQRYPKTSKNVQPDSVSQLNGNEQHKLNWSQRVLSKFFNKADQSKTSAIPRVYLRQYWLADPQMVKDNLKFPGGRMLLRAGDGTILNPDTDSDGPYGQQNPFFDGLWPYEMFDNEPDPDHPWGHAEITALKKTNEAFNRLGHSLVKTLIKNVPFIIADANALRPEDITDLKELEEIVLEKAAGRTVERIAPTAPTAISLEFMKMCQSIVEMETGLQDGAMQGKGRVEVRSQPQLEGLQQMAQVLVRAQARRLEAFLERCGQKLVSRVFQFCTDDRIYTYVDNDTVKEFEFNKEELRNQIVQQAQHEVEEEAKAETKRRMEKDGLSIEKAYVEPKLTEEDILEHVRNAWKLFRFKIIPFSSLASTRIQRAMLLEQLAEKHLIPGSMVLEEAGFDNPKELVKEAATELQEAATMGLPPPEPPKKGKSGGGKK